MADLGYQWLAHRFSIEPTQPFAVRSEIGRTRSSAQQDGIRLAIYPETYRPESDIAEHLTFAFKYEGIHLEFLARLFALNDFKEKLERWISLSPSAARVQGGTRHGKR